MPALRRRVSSRSFWIKLATAAFAVAVAVDWTRPAERQLSVPLYEHGVVAPYRALLWPVSSRFIRCRFRPTCSEYSLQAVRRYGFPRGGWLTFARILRCRPGVRVGTFDPVPAPH